MTRFNLDNAATTPLCPEAAEAMAPWIGGGQNASSLHELGRHAKLAIDEARETLAEICGCLFGELVFTSSGTEALNLAVVGTCLANQGSVRRRIAFSAAEHTAILATASLVQKLGFEVVSLPVDNEGNSDLSGVDDGTLLFAQMHANNETGRINDLAEAESRSKSCGSAWLCDAVQTFPCSVAADLFAASAHKFSGPLGAGLLVVRAPHKIEAVIRGGGQERELRAGTENVAAIVGMAAAARAARYRRADPLARDAFGSALIRQAGFVPTLHDWASSRVLPLHLHGRFPGVRAESLLIRLDRAGVAASSGPACSAGSAEPSHVLRAMGLPVAESAESVRFSLPAEMTILEAESAAAVVHKVVRSVRNAN